jgi:phage tail sheath protein FI
MPVAPTYPGVYIEEIPSGVRTITGVGTSIAAFVGSARRGPTDIDGPVTINSFGDFERIFGGLWAPSRLGFAVRDFFINGGTQAIIVRLVGAAGAPGELDLKAGAETLNLVAANSGAWGDNLSATVDHKTKNPANTKLFNLTVFETDPTTNAVVNSEKFLNVSVDPSDPRYLPRVLENGSALLRLKPGSTVPAASPEDTPVAPAVGPTKATAGKGKNGDALDRNSFTGTNFEALKHGLYALEKADLFNLLCIPPYKIDGNVDPELVGDATVYCEKRRAMMLVDPLAEWDTVAEAIGNPTANPATGIAAVGTSSKNAAFFFPRIRQSNPLHDGQIEEFVPCGVVAGVFARTDTQRGVWKAPAGLDATLVGVPQLAVSLTDAENGQLNPLGINCLRAMPAAGRVVWGSRTLQGNDRLASEWKYIPVRRTALYIEESLFRGTQWVVFEPNDEPLWAQIRLNVGAFMHSLFRQGAFQGVSPKDAYFVKCDKETTTQNDINLGIVNIVVGFAPLKPAEFVFIKLQQMAGQIET